MPGFGKSGTSRINDLRWSMSAFLSLDSKCRVRSCRLQVYLFHLIDYGPLRARYEIVLERLHTVRWSFGKRLDRAIRTVPHVTNNLMPCRCALRKETITDSLHFTSNQKLSRYSHDPTPGFYLHLNKSPCLPFSSVNVSVSSEPETFNVNVIVAPLISPL